MKIAQLNVYFYPKMVGGAEWYVYNISRYLAKKGHEVHVFTVDRYEGKKIGPSEEEIECVKIHRLPLWMDLTYRIKVWKGLKKLLSAYDFDVIHTYDYGQPHSRTAVKVAKGKNKPLALTVFDVHSMIPRPFYKDFAMKIFDNHLAGYVLKNATKILVRAPNLIEALVKFGANREKICVTPSGIIDEALEPADGKAFTEKFSIKGKPIILYLGRLHPMKGPQFIVKAAPQILKKYPKAVFVFVGSEQNDYKEKLIKLSQQLGVEKSLLFTGPIHDFETKMQAYAAADIFVMPSGYEGTSQAIFEAMAQAKPIAATNRGGIPFQVEHEKEALLFEYGDENALASAVLALLEDHQRALLLGKNAKEKVKKFTYSTLVNQLEGIYEEMISR
jgi:glycosyltransferase involved in cell wall biosynthesis